jgi:soluble lytic murein transglycosylase-like protein
VVPTVLPPYANVSQEASQCAAEASLHYRVPQELLRAIIAREGGKTGQCVKNKNGSFDCGLAQINSSWMPFFSKYGITPSDIVYSACTNVYLSAYILRYNYEKKKQSWFDAIISYNIGPGNWTPSRYRIGYNYARGVVEYWWRFFRWGQEIQARQGSGTPGYNSSGQGVFEAPDKK